MGDRLWTGIDQRREERDQRLGRVPVRDRVLAGVYRVCSTCPDLSLTKKGTYRPLLGLYLREKAQKAEQFKLDLFNEKGLLGHPKAEQCYALALKYGEGQGYLGVLERFEEFMALLDRYSIG